MPMILTNFGRQSDSSLSISSQSFCLRGGRKPQFGALWPLTLFWILLILLKPQAQGFARHSTALF